MKIAANTTVSASFIHPQGNAISPGLMGDRVSYYELKTVSGFESVLNIKALSEADSGIYRCSGIVMPTKPNSYVVNATGRAIFRIALSRKLHWLLVVMS